MRFQPGRQSGAADTAGRITDRPVMQWMQAGRSSWRRMCGRGEFSSVKAWRRWLKETTGAGDDVLDFGT